MLKAGRRISFVQGPFDLMQDDLLHRLGHEQEHFEVLVGLVWTGATALCAPSGGDIFNGIALSARAVTASRPFRSTDLIMKS